MNVFVLLYEPGTDNEGIHSLELKGITIVLMFENKDDAERYSGLLEAQDFPCPSVESLDKEEIQAFCEQQGYKAQLIENGFMPSTDEERLYLSPPEANLSTSTWKEDVALSKDDLPSQKESNKHELDIIKKRLENLL